MEHRFIEDFCWSTIDWKSDLPAGEKYQMLVNWAGGARGKNPDAFDKITRWMLDDSQWGSDRLEENRQLYMDEFVGRFRRQCGWLRSCLEELKPSGVVNEAVFPALDRFEDELAGRTWVEELKEPVTRMFEDFSSMGSRALREQIAGGVTGHTGTDAVDNFGYINYLKDCDASVQWALFMPEVVENQQKDFHIKSFEYRTLPAMRFVGFAGDEMSAEERLAWVKKLDALSAYASELKFDVRLTHHNGECVDVAEEIVLCGRFMAADCPVPEGFCHLDFLPKRVEGAGAPYISQFAFAEFEGDPEAMNSFEGFDCTGMYDVTRNTMLGQGVNIPYPDKYWVAEAYLQGFGEPCTAYMFSAEL